jgi:predicted Zn-dependent protease
VASAEREAAERLLEQGRHEEAVARFRKLLAADPEDPLLRSRLAEAYRAQGNPDRAFHHFDQAARTLAALGKDQLAADVLARADAVVPDQPEILFRRAKALERLGDEAALEPTCERLVIAAKATGDRRRGWALERLVRLRPHDRSMSATWARFLLEAGREAEALSALETLLAQLGPEEPVPEGVASAVSELPELGRALAETALERGDPRGAIAALVPLHARDPESPRTLRLIVRALEALGPAAAGDTRARQLRTARLELIKAEIRADGPDALAARERPARVIPVIERLLAEVPRDAEALEVSAHALAVLEHRVEAGRLWARLVELHHAAGHPGARDRAILQLLRAASDVPEALRVAARILAEAGRGAEAEALEGRIAALLPPAPRDEAPRPPTYGRGLSSGQPAGPRERPDQDLGDTLEDALGEGHDTDDMAPDAASEGDASRAAAELEAAVAHIGEPQPEPRSAFARRFPSNPGGRAADVLPEDLSDPTGERR